MLAIVIAVAVSFADLAVFPSWEQCWHNSALAQARLERAEVYKTADLETARHVWKCWQALERGARGNRGDLIKSERLKALEELRELLGEDNYKTGKMPEPEEPK